MWSAERLVLPLRRSQLVLLPLAQSRQAPPVSGLERVA